MTDVQYQQVLRLMPKTPFQPGSIKVGEWEIIPKIKKFVVEFSEMLVRNKDRFPQLYEIVGSIDDVAVEYYDFNYEPGVLLRCCIKTGNKHFCIDAERLSVRELPPGGLTNKEKAARIMALAEDE